MTSNSQNHIANYIETYTCNSQLQKSKPVLLELLKKESDENELYIKYHKLFENYYVESFFNGFS